MTARAAFRKADIDRAIAVVKSAGFEIAAVEIRPDGTIRIVTALTEGGEREANPWDRTCAVE